MLNNTMLNQATEQLFMQRLHAEIRMAVAESAEAMIDEFAKRLKEKVAQRLDHFGIKLDTRLDIEQNRNVFHLTMYEE